MRLALAGQAEYKVQDRNNNNEVEIEPQGNIFVPTTHEYIDPPTENNTYTLCIII